MLDINGRFVICQFTTENQNSYTLVTIYAPNTDQPSFFDALAQNLCEFDGPYIIVGDYNLVMNPKIDRFSSSLNKKKSHKVLMQMIEDLHLEEIWRCRNSDVKRYSWHNGKDGNDLRASRINFVLASSGISTMCENIMYIPGIYSDHSAIFAHFSDNVIPRGPGYWKLNTTVLENEYVKAQITQHCLKDLAATTQKDPQERYLYWKSSLIKKLQALSRNIASQKSLIIAQLSETIGMYENNMPLNKVEHSIYNRSKADLEEHLFEKTKSTMFRAKAKWYMEAEKRTKYFLNIEKARARAKSTNSIITESGEQISDNSKILAEQAKFYKSLYSSNLDVKFQLSNTEEIKLKQQTINMLAEPISMQELTKAVFSMKNNKSPGPDGLPPEIYKLLWPLIGTSFHSMLQHAFQQGSLHESIKRGVLNLIPKAGKDSRKLSNLRPITLLNTDYKIIEKVIAARFEAALPDIIHQNQTGFMKKRRMAVNVRKIFELMNYCARNNIDAFIYDLDFLKAFDHVEFSGINGSLRYFHFPENIIKWVSILYNSFHVKIQNNGYFSERIDIERSVHQGGCMSSYLFNVCVETLAIEIRKNMNILGIQAGGKEHKLGQYADDTDIFSLFDQRSLNAINSTLENFNKNTGLQISYDKTSLYRIGSLKNSDAELYSEKPIAWTNDSLKVLGICVTYNQNLLDLNYAPVIDRAEAIRHQWCNRDISLMGKIAVINSLVSSLFVHKMTVLPNLTPQHITKLNNLLTQFIWNKRKAKISLRNLQASKKDGGIGLTNLHIKQQAMKITWISMLNENEDFAALAYSNFAPVMKVDIFKCAIHLNDVQEALRGCDDIFWIQVMEAWAALNYPLTQKDSPFAQSIWFNSNVKIDDKLIWWPESYRKGLMWFSQLYENGQLISIGTAYRRFSLSLMQFNAIISAVPRVWRVTMRCQTDTDEAKNQVPYDRCVAMDKLAKYAYAQLLPSAQPSEHTLNKWKEELSLPITIQNIYDECLEMYKVSNIVKLRSFQYRVIYRALVLNIHLYRWGMIRDNRCSLCHTQPETLYHLFWECAITQHFWEEVRSVIKLFTNQQIQFNYCEIMFNSLVDNRKHIANFVCLAAKQFIYRQRCLNGSLNINLFKEQIYLYKNSEKYYAMQAGLLSKHNAKWNPDAVRIASV